MQTMLKVLIFPLLILVLGAILGAGVVGIYLPLISLISSMTG